jgi:hypothetical protein
MMVLYIQLVWSTVDIPSSVGVQYIEFSHLNVLMYLILSFSGKKDFVAGTADSGWYAIDFPIHLCKQ